MRFQDFIERIDENRLLRAIQEAESRCSGEIRVHVEPRLRGRAIREVAERTFERLGMTRTELRNGVLVFIAAEEQQFSVIGDLGIHEHVDDQFWSDVVSGMSKEFREGRFTEGVVGAVERTGSRLAEFFPRAGDDMNELTDAISVGEDQGDEDRK